MSTAALIVPFRDRGTDPLRKANLEYVLNYWRPYGLPIHVTADGRTGTQQFNRHAAYNRAASVTTTADILCYVESDMIIPFTQMDKAIAAAEQPGLVVPFTARHELGPEDSEKIRGGADPTTFRADIIKPKPRRIGAINILSRSTLDTVGQWDEQFEGNWWDDRSMAIAFQACAGPTRWIDGPAWHLHHLPGHTGAHLSAEDKAATARNHERHMMYRRAKTPEQIRALTTGK